MKHEKKKDIGSSAPPRNARLGRPPPLDEKKKKGRQPRGGLHPGVQKTHKKSDVAHLDPPPASARVRPRFPRE